jgi:hypothetical protein
MKKPLKTKAQKAPRAARKPKPVEIEVDWAALEPRDVNESEVNEITDRIFGSVLSRHGWRRDSSGHMEHVGSDHEAAA